MAGNERKNYTQNFPLVGKDVKLIDFAETRDALTIERNNRLATVQINASPGHRIRNLDYTQWKVGTSGTQFSFIANGTASENTIVSGVGPYGATIPLWKCYNSDAASDADGGWNADIPHIGFQAPYYRYSVWIKCEGNQNGTTYLGCRGESVQTLAGVADTNPYFWYGDLPAMGQWYLIVGHIHGYQTSYGKNANSGIYNTAGVKVAETLNDYRYTASPRCHQHRCYLYYTTSAATVQYMAYPRIDIISGVPDEAYPSLASLISGAWVSYEDAKEKSWLVGTNDMVALRTEANGLVRYGSNQYPSWIDPSLSKTINIRACHLEQVRQIVDDSRNNARCASSCNNDCSRACSSACYSVCTTTCGGNCYYSCGGVCTGKCSSGCVSGCFSDCNNCVNWCGCYGSCKGSCDSGCGGGCTSGCGAACSGQSCVASCSVNCYSASCSSSCSTDCNTGCAASCYTACNISCLSGCSYSARQGTDPASL